MDPITGAVVGMVVWFFAGAIGCAVFAIGGAIAGGFFAEREDDGVIAGYLIGWIIGVCWFVFALVMAIIQLVHLVQLLTV